MYPIDRKILSARMSHLSLLLLSMIIFSFQVKEFADEYFAYKTISKVSLTSSDSVPPAISLCIRYSDIMDWEAFMSAINTSRETTSNNNKPSRSSEFREYSHSMTLPTIQQIHEFTPSVNDSLTGILYRTANDFKMRNVLGKDVYSHIHVTKYYVQEYMCYNYFLRDQSVIRFKHIVSSLTNAGMIYRLSLSRQLMGANKIHATIFYQDDAKDFPGYSKMFGSLADRLDPINQTDHPLATDFMFAYSVYKMIGLEAPYDTKCRSRGATFDCLFNCLTEGYRVIDRSPFQIFHDQDVDLSRKHVNAADLGNKTLAEHIIRVDDRCTARCQTTICTVSFTRTDFSYMYLHPAEVRFDIVVLAPNKPDTLMISVPMMTFSDLIYFVCSCFTIWFGISVYSCNPFAAATLH